MEGNFPSGFSVGSLRDVTISETLAYRRGLSCARCGYDTSGVTAVCCPECGEPLPRYSTRLRAVMESSNAFAILRIGGKLQGQRVARWYHILRTPAWQIEPVDLLAGLIREPECTASLCLRELGCDTESMVQEIVDLLPAERAMSVSQEIRLRLSGSSAKLVSQLLAIGFASNDVGAGTEHLLIALVECEDPALRVISRVHGLTTERIMEFVRTNRERIAEGMRQLPGNA